MDKREGFESRGNKGKEQGKYEQIKYSKPSSCKEHVK